MQKVRIYAEIPGSYDTTPPSSPSLANPLPRTTPPLPGFRFSESEEANKPEELDVCWKKTP